MTPAPRLAGACAAGTGRGCRIRAMSVEELESEALRLDPGARARLAERLLLSLDELSERENAVLWAAEARRRDAELDSDSSCGRAAPDVIAEARSRIR